MIFGIYPGSESGTDTGLATGKPDEPKPISHALSELVGQNKIFLVRGYIHYLGEGKLGNEAPKIAEQYINANIKLDLVLCYRSNNYEENDWINAIRKVIERYKEHLYSIQITEEPNLKIAFAGDGSFANIEKALMTGVVTAKQEITKQHLDIKVGFNSVPSFNPADNFWNVIGSDEFKKLREAIDYIGLDFFPDVFRPVAADGQPNDLTQSVINVLKYFRNVNLKTANIPGSIPIHITENGWATGNNRSYEKQSQLIEKIIRTIYSIKDELNINTYELFGLRDVNTMNQDIFYQFGILKTTILLNPLSILTKNLLKNLNKNC